MNHHALTMLQVKAVNVAATVTTPLNAGSDFKITSKYAERHVCSLDELFELCVYWKEVLGLQNWEISLSIKRGDKFSLPYSCLGECTWNLATSSAYINVLDDIDFPCDQTFPHDMEKTLVHELLHLHMGLFFTSESESLEHSFMERTIVRLADSLVNLKRGYKYEQDC